MWHFQIPMIFFNARAVKTPSRGIPFSGCLAIKANSWEPGLFDSESNGWA